MGDQEASPEFPFAHLVLVPTSAESQSRLRLVRACCTSRELAFEAKSLLLTDVIGGR